MDKQESRNGLMMEPDRTPFNDLLAKQKMEEKEKGQDMER